MIFLYVSIVPGDAEAENTTTYASETFGTVNVFMLGIYALHQNWYHKSVRLD